MNVTTWEMVECPEHEGAFDCTPFCPKCEGEQEVNDPAKGRQLLLETMDEHLAPVARLYEWAENCGVPSPFVVFLDLSGLSHEMYGQGLCGYTVNAVGEALGFLEMSYIAGALEAYSTRPLDVAEYVRALIASEYVK